jgi:hypothetical protein
MTTDTLTPGLYPGDTTAILATPRQPRIFLHGEFQPGLGLLPKEVKTFYEKHGRVLVLTGPAFVLQTVKSLQRMGISAVGLTMRQSQDQRKDAIDAFNAADSSVLVVSAHWSHGWKVDAKCIVMTGLNMPGLFKHVSEVIARGEHPDEIHFIDCHWPPHKAEQMVRFFSADLLKAISTLDQVTL